MTSDPGGKGRPPGGNLDDPVALALGQPFQDGVGRGQGGDVDGRVGETPLPGPVEHFTVGLIIGNRHKVSFSDFGKAVYLKRGFWSISDLFRI